MHKWSNIQRFNKIIVLENYFGYVRFVRNINEIIGIIGVVCYGVKHHFQQYFSYIEVVGFIGGGNRRKTPTCR